MRPFDFKSLCGRLALLTAALIWGSSFIVMKDAVADVPVFLLLALRFTIGTVLLGALFFPRLRRANRGALRQGVLCGVLLLAAYSVQTFGLVGTTPGKNAFLTAVYCVLVPFAGWLLFKKHPTRWNWLAAVTCLAGIGLVSLQGDLTIAVGDALTLLGGVIYALHVIALGRATRQHDAIAVTIVQFGVSAALAWVCSLLTEPGAAFPMAAAPQLAFLGIFATAGALLLQSLGQRETPPAQAAILLSLESVFGVLFSVIMGAETLTFPLVCGFVLIFLSVIISETELKFLRKN